MPRSLTLLLALVTLACAKPSVASVPRARILALPSGEALSFDELTERLLEARVVYVGEHHDREADHAAQRAIVEALHRRDPSLAIGLEMVQRPQQAALDAYVDGVIDEATLLERIAWTERWGFDFALYRSIFALAAEHRLPMIALNAPSELTRAVARGGLDALSADQRAMLPAELDLTSAPHRRMVEDALRDHPGMSEAMLDRFYAAQVVWDETMAEQVAAFLERSPARMVVLAGMMHVSAGLGIPDRAARRGAAPHAIVLPIMESELDEALRAEPPLADFLWVVPEG
jgi:uncharacterized iron-regulated protein